MKKSSREEDQVCAQRRHWGASVQWVGLIYDRRRGCDVIKPVVETAINGSAAYKGHMHMVHCLNALYTSPRMAAKRRISICVRRMD